MSQIELVTLSGHDQQGLISGVMDILANYGANILDIGESVIYSNIILGILVETSDGVDDEKRRQHLKDFVKDKFLRLVENISHYSAYLPMEYIVMFGVKWGILH